MRFFFAFAFTWLSITACSSQHTQEQLAKEWPTIDPQQVIENFEDFKKHTSNADTLKGLKSLLVFQDGKLVFEKYYNGHAVDKKYHVRSITKSFIAMLVGIAIDQGLISSVDEPIKPYLTEFVARRHHSKLDNMTIHHLLTMSSGFEWDESKVSGYVNWGRSDDKIAYLLERSIAEQPGAKFEYNSAGAHLLSVVLEKMIDRPVLEFAKEHLLDPLGISMEDVAYEKDNRGYLLGGAGMELRARDMAKFGMLIMNKGTFNGKRIVSEEWIEKTTHNHMPAPVPGNGGRLYTAGYGYLWWIMKVLDEDVPLAWGWGGQFIMPIASKNTMIVTNNRWFVGDQANSQQIRATFRTMLGILESMR